MQQDFQPLTEAGRSRRELAQSLAALPDAMLGVSIRWQESMSPLGVVLEQVGAYQRPRANMQRLLAEMDWDAPAAVRHLQWAPIARARLEASLAGVPDALLDVQPFAGEWSVRQQLAHVELTDIRYGIATRYAVQRRDSEPLSAPSEAYPPRQDNPAGNPGEPLADILERMRRVRAAALVPLLDISAAGLLRPTEWHTAEHTIGFRLHRFAQHDLELTTDIQRTLAAAGFRPSKAIGLAASFVEAWGELESVLLGVPADLYDAAPSSEGPSLRAYVQSLTGADQQLLAQIHSAAV